MSQVSHTALRLYDNTRLSAYKRCPRFYWFRHERHWEPDGKRLPLIFGACWHAAQEVIWAAMTPPAIPPNKETIVKAAYGAFVDTWLKEGGPPLDEIDYEMEKEFAPRTPGTGLEMIVGYVEHRIKNQVDFELMAVEKGFAVPLNPEDPTLFYIGKIDKIVNRRGKVLGIEHKTTTAYSKTNKFRSTFLESFSPNAQVDGYAYALHLMYPGKAGAIWVDAALVHKSDEGFIFIPVERQLAQLDGWLWETLDWIRRLEADQKAVENVRESDPYMHAFPKNTNSCWDFMSACPYLGPCKAWSNPKNKPIPAGYTEKKWDPLEHLPPIEGINAE